MTQLRSSARTLDAAALGDGHDAGRPVEAVVLRDDGRDAGAHLVYVCSRGVPGSKRRVVILQPRLMPLFRPAERQLNVNRI